MIGLSRKSVGLDQRCRQSIVVVHFRSVTCSKFNVLIMDSNNYMIVIPHEHDDESTENNLLDTIFNHPGGKARSEVWKVFGFYKLRGRQGPAIRETYVGCVELLERSIVMYSRRFLCRPTAFFPDLLEPWDVRELYIRKTADLPLQLCVDTFPRFVAIGCYFLSESLI